VRGRTVSFPLAGRAFARRSPRSSCRFHECALQLGSGTTLRAASPKAPKPARIASSKRNLSAAFRALRDHFRRAGVRRADLHEERPTTKLVTFYDLRSTGITWEVLAGTEPLRVQQRAGHRVQHHAELHPHGRRARRERRRALPSVARDARGSSLGSSHGSPFATWRRRSRFVASPTGFEGAWEQPAIRGAAVMRDPSLTP
jgi:hypothetical protein